MAGGQVQLILIWLTALAGYAALRTWLRPGRRQAANTRASRSDRAPQRRSLPRRLAALMSALAALTAGLAVAASAVLPEPVASAAVDRPSPGDGGRHRVPSYYSGTPGGGNGAGADSPGTVVARWQIPVRTGQLAPVTVAGMTLSEWNRLLLTTYQAMDQHRGNEIGDLQTSLSMDVDEVTVGLGTAAWFDIYEPHQRLVLHAHVWNHKHGRPSPGDILYLRGTDYQYGYVLEHSRGMTRLWRYDRKGRMKVIARSLGAVQLRSLRQIVMPVVMPTPDVMSEASTRSDSLLDTAHTLEAADKVLQRGGRYTLQVSAALRLAGELAQELGLINSSAIDELRARLSYGTRLSPYDRNAAQTELAAITDELGQAAASIMLNVGQSPVDLDRASDAAAYLRWLINPRQALRKLPKYIRQGVTEEDPYSVKNHLEPTYQQLYHYMLSDRVRDALRLALLKAAPENIRERLQKALDGDRLAQALNDLFLHNMVTVLLPEKDQPEDVKRLAAELPPGRLGADRWLLTDALSAIELDAQRLKRLVRGEGVDEATLERWDITPLNEGRVPQTTVPTRRRSYLANMRDRINDVARLIAQRTAELRKAKAEGDSERVGSLEEELAGLRARLSGHARDLARYLDRVMNPGGQDVHYVPDLPTVVASPQLNERLLDRLAGLRTAVTDDPAQAGFRELSQVTRELMAMPQAPVPGRPLQYADLLRLREALSRIQSEQARPGGARPLRLADLTREADALITRITGPRRRFAPPRLPVSAPLPRRARAPGSDHLAGPTLPAITHPVTELSVPARSGTAPTTTLRRPVTTLPGPPSPAAQPLPASPTSPLGRTAPDTGPATAAVTVPRTGTSPEVGRPAGTRSVHVAVTTPEVGPPTTELGTPTSAMPAPAGLVSGSARVARPAPKLPAGGGSSTGGGIASASNNKLDNNGGGPSFAPAAPSASGGNAAPQVNPADGNGSAPPTATGVPPPAQTGATGPVVTPATVTTAPQAATAQPTTADPSTAATQPTTPDTSVTQPTSADPVTPPADSVTPPTNPVTTVTPPADPVAPPVDPVTPPVDTVTTPVEPVTASVDPVTIPDMELVAVP